MFSYTRTEAKERKKRGEGGVLSSNESVLYSGVMILPERETRLSCGLGEGRKKRTGGQAKRIKKPKKDKCGFVMGGIGAGKKKSANPIKHIRRRKGGEG